MYVSGKFTATLQNQHNEVRDLISGPGNYTCSTQISQVCGRKTMLANKLTCLLSKGSKIVA